MKDKITYAIFSCKRHEDVVETIETEKLEIEKNCPECGKEMKKVLTTVVKIPVEDVAVYDLITIGNSYASYFEVINISKSAGKFKFSLKGHGVLKPTRDYVYKFYGNKFN